MKTVENKFPSKLIALAALPLVALGLVLVLSNFTGQAVAAPTGSAPFAVGGITLMDGTHVAFAAQQNPQNPLKYAGYVVQDFATGSRSGPVFCLFVYGNMARVIWTVKKSDFNDAGQTRQFDVTDNGEPMFGMSPDLFMDLQDCDQDGWNSNTECNCTTTGGGGVMPLHGNIVVKGP